MKPSYLTLCANARVYRISTPTIRPPRLDNTIAMNRYPGLSRTIIDAPTPLSLSRPGRAAVSRTRPQQWSSLPNIGKIKSTNTGIPSGSQRASGLITRALLERKALTVRLVPRCTVLLIVRSQYIRTSTPNVGNGIMIAGGSQARRM